MTLRLILTRHAKSDWSHAGLADHERPLNRRGRASASAIGKWLEERGYRPDTALVSSATRTQETWARIARELTSPAALLTIPGLYLADREEMLAILGRAPAGCVILIAHNPGSASMAGGLARVAPDDPRFRRYPTAATCVFEFDAESWAQVGWNTGQVVDFIKPRDLLT